MADSGTNQKSQFLEGYDFEDGNVVLSVIGRSSSIKYTDREANARKRRAVGDDTPEETMLFRVHKSLLASYSTVFSDMFVVGASSASTMVADLPVAQLQDKPDDILNLLRFIYKPETVPRDPFTPKKFAFDASLLLLSDKYDMPRIKDALLPEIISLWPQSLHSWDQREKRRKPQHQVPRWTISNERGRVVDPTSAIRLGRDFPLSQILPSAFYALASLPANNKEAPDYSFLGFIPDLEPLDRNDFVTLFTGQAGLRNCMSKAVEGFWIDWCCPDHVDVVYPSGPDDDVEHWDNAECPKAKIVAYWNQRCHNMRMAMTSPRLDVLDCLLVEYERVISDMSHRRDNLCYECLNKIADHLMQSRMNIWRKLPQLFDLQVPNNWGKAGSQGVPT